MSGSNWICATRTVNGPSQRNCRGKPELLSYDLVRNLPVTLFDRPLPIPQPGYAQTQGGVNMRAAPRY